MTDISSASPAGLPGGTKEVHVGAFRNIVPGKVIESTSALEAVALVSREVWPHSLRIGSPARGLRSRIAFLQIGDCAVAEVDYGANVEIDAGVIDGAYLVSLCSSGLAEVRCGERRLLAPGTIVIPSPAVQTRFAQEAGTRTVTVRIPRGRVEALARRLYFFDETTPLEFELEASIGSEFGRAFMTLVQHICVLASAAPTALRTCGDSYAHLLAETLLKLHPHNFSQRPIQWRELELPHHLRQALDYIDTRLPAIECVREVADEVSVTERCLQKSFRRWLSLTPGEYLRERRLGRLRELLQGPGRATSTITELMLSVGITESGRYAGYYQQRFGEAPSATRLKEGSGCPRGGLRRPRGRRV